MRKNKTMSHEKMPVAKSEGQEWGELGPITLSNFEFFSSRAQSEAEATQGKTASQFENRTPLTIVKEKTADELREDIKHYREQIKIGETKNAEGKYNEELVLSSEASLREAEKELAAINKKAEDNTEIEKLRGEIASYREQIKVGETKSAGGSYNEELVLDSENKLRAAENRIREIENGPQKPVENTPEPEKPIVAPLVSDKKPKKKLGILRRLFGGQEKKAA